MKNEILTRITIPAQLTDVWAALADFSSYADWNPFIQRIEGRCEVGATLQITLRKPSSGKLYSFKATVTACDPGRLLQWEGALGGMRWLFCGVHSFELRAMSGGATELVHKENFTGVLSSSVFASIRADTERGFESMNQALSSTVQTAAIAKGGSSHA